MHNLRREFAAAQGRAEAVIEIAGKHRMPDWLANASIARGFALVGLGRQADGVAQLRAGMAGRSQLGASCIETQWLGLVAEAHAQAGQFADALAGDQG